MGNVNNLLCGLKMEKQLFEVRIVVYRLQEYISDVKFNLLARKLLLGKERYSKNKDNSLPS